LITNNKTIDLSIVICTYNRAQMLDDVLKSFSALKPVPDMTFELIVVDNNSSDNTRGIVERWQSRNEFPLRYLLEKRQGISYARNLAISEGKGNWLWFLDDDVYLDENWLQGVTDVIWNYPEAMAIAGKIVLEFERPEPEWLPDIAYNYFGLTRFGDSPRWLKHDEYPIGANVAIRKVVFECVGLFNSKLGRVGNSLISWDETEFFMRLYRSSGQIVYTPHVIVRHRITKQQLSKTWLIRRMFSDGVSQVIAENENSTRNRKQLFSCVMDRLRFIFKEFYKSQFSFPHQLKYIRETGCILQYLIYAFKADR